MLRPFALLKFLKLPRVVLRRLWPRADIAVPLRNVTLYTVPQEGSPAIGALGRVPLLPLLKWRSSIRLKVPINSLLYGLAVRRENRNPVLLQTIVLFAAELLRQAQCPLLPLIGLQTPLKKVLTVAIMLQAW